MFESVDEDENFNKNKIAENSVSIVDVFIISNKKKDAAQKNESFFLK